MKFEIEAEPLPAGRARNGHRNIVIIACTAVICVQLIIVYFTHEAVHRQESRLGYDPGLRGHDRGQGGVPGTAGQLGEPGLPGPTGSAVKSRPPGPARPVGGVETGGIQNLSAFKGIVEGIIAGTLWGVVIIALDSREQRTICSGFTRGVAFNWQSRKVYWIEGEGQVGIKIADLDGRHAELLISDPNLRGLAVDQITGNLYYGVLGSNPRIRVCDSMGKKCVTVASEVSHVGIDIWDIALLPSEGLMFWSRVGDKKIVHRANMDGTNATTIILGDIWGFYLDEFTEKLYWANNNGKSIGHHDLNRYNRNVLLNTTTYPLDIAVDGDTLYFGGVSPSGVYSATSNGQVSFIANTAGPVYHIALFGRNKVPSRPNPCKDSPCANLCVLTRLAFTCL